jgi:TolB-like protein/AraC-like DNA-binding protein/Tfp pilus assembly protein PilF
MSEHLPSNQIFIRKLTTIIHANLSNENFGPRELARESGVSLYRLNRRLHLINRKTSSQFIRELRLQKALEFLRNEEYTVSEVAYKSGFSSPSYFISCFREYFGYPPGKVKKEGFESHEENVSGSKDFKPEQKGSSRRIFILASTGILILAVIIYIFYTLFSGNFTHDEGTSSIDKRKSIAVLPFRNRSDDITDQYVYDGIMEEITNNLTKIRELGVISNTSVEQFRNTTKSVPEIGKQLEVDYIIEAGGQKFGSTFRIRVQLIEVATDTHIWSKSFQHRMKKTRKLFRTQSRIARNIASELKAVITREESDLIEKVPTVNWSAYNLYLKANSYQNDIKSTSNPKAYQNAVRLYSAAIAIDSGFAKAYTGLAYAYWNRYFYETYFEKNYLDSCLILAEKALSYDDQLDEAYFIKGEYYRVKGQQEKALDNYDKALGINPNYYQAYYWKGYLLTWVQGDYVKGLDNYHKALNLIRNRERAILSNALGIAYRDAGFPEQAKYYFNEAFVLDSNRVSYLGNVAFLEFSVENFDKALELWEQQKKLDSTSTGIQNYYFVTPGHSNETYNLAVKDIDNLKKSGTLNLVRSHRVGYAFWQAGKKKEGEFYFNQQIKYSEESIEHNRLPAQRKAAQYDLAGTYAFLGDKVKAYSYLDEFVKRNTFPIWMVTFIKHDLLFSSLRHEERFQNIVQRVVAKYQSEHERVRKWLEEQGML